MENSCLICGSRDKTILLETHDKRYSLNKKNNKYNLVKCTKCGFVYLDYNVGNLSEFLINYPARYWETTPKNRLLQSIQQCLLRVKYRRVISNTKCGKLLDVGCGTGELIAYCQKQGWDVYGQDVSPAAYKNARRKVSNIYCGRLEDAPYKERYFDKILLCSVLHQMKDPKKELTTIKKLLKKDGQLILTVPDISSWQYVLSKSNWFHLDSPRHLYYFQPKSIAKLMDITGFKIKEINFPLEDCPLDLFHSIKTYFPRIFWIILLPIAIILKIIPNFRGVMEVVAVPTDKQ